MLPALLLRRVRRVAGPAAGGRRSPGGARAPEEEARTDAAGRHRHRGFPDARARVARALRRAGCRTGHRARGCADGLSSGWQALSSKRRAAAKTFSARLVASLADLAMTRTRCEVRFAAPRGPDGWSARGMDEAEFYISPNPGEDLRPLARIASGGELSRLMLALKTLASTDAPGKTLIFDEVDAGIGGAVADIVGARLRELAGECQVLCITHLPQIAAYGGTHYRIEKALKSGRTVTSVTRLGVREREEELARMIAGSEVSASVRASAREMLKRKGAAAADQSAGRGPGRADPRVRCWRIIQRIKRERRKRKSLRGKAKLSEWPGNTSSRLTA